MATERTRDIYEEIAGYPKPPLAPLPDPYDLSDLEQLGFRLGTFSRWVIYTGMLAAGFTSFQRQLPNTVEDLLRRCNTRGPILFAPILSASLTLEDDPRNLSPFTRAATLLFAARRLYREIVSAKLPPDLHGDQPLEMGLYPNLFSTNIVVEKKTARLFKSTNDSYVIVVVAGRFYRLDLSDTTPDTDVQQLTDSLIAVARDARGRRRPIDDPSPGVLTCGGHRTQLKAFRRLRRTPTNVGSLEIMKHNFLTLCLDLDDQPGSYEEAARFAHSLNCSNRWHHSSLQVVVFGNAKACAICNFNAYLDGNTMIRGASELQRMALDCPVPSSEKPRRVEFAKPMELSWRIDGRAAQQAGNDMRKVQDGQRATFTIEGIGRDAFTAHGVDPVAGFTLAVQIAVKRLTGRVARVEQFLSMSRYRCMGLALSNVTTPEVVKFVEHVVGRQSGCGQAARLLLAAVDSQIERCRSVRRALPLGLVLSLFVNSRSRVGRVYALFVTALTMFLLRLLKAVRGRSEVMISHPAIHAEVPVMGRPGIRLTYVKYFGLHYQLFRESTVLTVMPGVSWHVPNSELVAVLQDSLEQVRSIVAGQAQEGRSL